MEPILIYFQFLEIMLHMLKAFVNHLESGIKVIAELSANPIFRVENVAVPILVCKHSTYFFKLVDAKLHFFS